MLADYQGKDISRSLWHQCWLSQGCLRWDTILWWSYIWGDKVDSSATLSPQFTWVLHVLRSATRTLGWKRIHFWISRVLGIFYWNQVHWFTGVVFEYPTHLLRSPQGCPYVSNAVSISQGNASWTHDLVSRWSLYLIKWVLFFWRWKKISRGTRCRSQDSRKLHTSCCCDSWFQSTLFSRSDDDWIFL